MTDNIMTVQMFGGFSISLSGCILIYQNDRSKKVWTILAYLIALWDREISKELVSCFWGDRGPPQSCKRT